jgi:hypothetical protein
VLATRLIAAESEVEDGPVGDRMKTTYLVMVLAVAALFAARPVLLATRRTRGER